MGRDSRLRVALLINALPIGGAERLLVELIEAAPDTVDFEVLYLGSEDTMVPRFQRAGATVQSLNETFRFDLRAIYRLGSHIKQTDPDVLHLHLPYAQTVGRLAAWATSCAVVSTHHNVPSNYHLITRTSERITRPLDDVTVAVSRGVERAFTGRSHPANELGDRWCTIYNGIDVDGFHTEVKEATARPIRESLGIPPSAPVVLNVARYVPVKGQRELVRSFAAANSTEAHLVLVGHGPMEDRIRETATSEGIAPRVHVTGQVSSVEPYYSLADAFVLASRAEGFGVVLLEAMASKLPVVAPNIRGVREIVIEDRTGLLYPSGDFVALTGHLDRIFGGTEHAEMGRAGFHRASREFDSERMTTTYVDLYRRLVGDDR